MTERPNTVLAALIAAAAAAAALLAAGLFALAGQGAPELAATVLSAFTACVFFLLEPGQIPFSAIVIVLMSVASLLGLVATARAYVREKRLLDALPVDEPPDRSLAEEVRRVGVPVLVFPSSRPIAFCAGLIRPRIVVSAGLLARLAPDERSAVLWHEVAHARNREPLKCLVARAAVQTFFWLPVLRTLLERYLLVKEIEADRIAMSRTSRRALAGALAQALPAPAPVAAAGFGEAAAARVDRLFAADAELPPLVRPWHVLASIAALSALATALAFPATLDPAASERIWRMLSTMSLHGLPGMLAGLVANVGMFAAAALLARRLRR